MDIHIRQATKEDAIAFNDIIAACSQQLDEQGYDHWRYFYNSSETAGAVNKAKTFVATFRGEVIGCVCYDASVDGNYFSKDYTVSLNQKLLAYITTLAVHPKFQNQGTGDKLMDFVEAIAKREGRIPILTMRHELKNLVEMYSRRDYVEIGRMIVGHDEQYSLLLKEFKE